jgi:hypothetical protein
MDTLPLLTKSTFFINNFGKISNKENSPIGEPSGEDRGVVALILNS